MKYDEVNWLEWPGSPERQTFDDWIIARKSKKHPTLTHTAMSKYSKHVSKAVCDGVCTIDQAFGYAAEAGWRAIMYQYIVSAAAKDMEMFSPAIIQRRQIENRSTRDMTLADDLDKSWAH